MSLLHIEGFDFAPADLDDFPGDGLIRATTGWSTGNATCAATYTRWGTGQAFESVQGGFSGSSLATTPGFLFNLAGGIAATHHVIVGFAYHPRLSDGAGIMSFVNAAGEQVAGMGISPIGYLTIYGASGSGSTNPAVLLTDGSHPLANNQWHYIEAEFYAASNGSGGVFKVWVNGVLVFNYAGSVTGGGATDYAVTDWYIGAAAGPGNNNTWPYGGPADYDDVYVIVADGTAPVTKLGDCRVEAIYPDAEASPMDYNRHGGTGASDAVGVGSCDGDTTYYQGHVANDEALFNSTGTLTGVPLTIHGVGVTHVSRKTAAGTRGVKPVLNDNATDYLGTEDNMTTGYGRYQTIWTVRPSNSAAWSKTTVEAAKFGVKITT